MFKDQCISVTDLRTNTKKCLSDLKKYNKFIFVNNKPTAVLVDIDVYEAHFSPVEIVQLDQKDITPQIKKLAEKTRKMDPSELVNV